MYSPATASHPPRRGGFTVIEFLVCMSVLGLLLALAVPAFGRWLREAEMTRAVNALVTDVHRARQTAHMQARTVKGQGHAPFLRDTETILAIEHFLVTSDG